ncbi:MAG: alpha-L-fucosidase [Bacteroidetes bacterium GWF2_42_66]|nr:MAG: alpha-L-fucosidase [Bacteroidetes bacterium GWA2_42_15]OFX98829.1 MAG: alpha-L-fucosidase [Bacteroidetes bacterium GWE2_42_39]OFY43203.1 MAG: alpha-L-fucosidase [Bacteroidetes bacterium GWF2_42_66]HBL77070.1 alpha-L-fucosidase [Prolixibacteraceae bacterium]HCR89578.1 alpha-L-fucosidase [Prolixibacteraceae bacterium]
MKRKIHQLFTFALLIAASSLMPVTPALAQKFEPTPESFKQYQYPEWFRDAKFGIWSHWGPQAVPRQGDWYARKMYESDIIDRKTNTPTGKPSEDYLYHIEHYGHPSNFGYKDIIPLWKAERWDPEQLMKLYRKVGAKYFVSMGTHHDNFFLWDSKIHRWNSVKMGPKKDVVGLWQEAAKKEGLRFGVSEHLGASYTWFQPSRGADKTGPMAGVPYDGANPAFKDLYHRKTSPDDIAWLTTNPENQKNWLMSITELIDMYKPDLLYSDSELPFGETGRIMLAHFYNQDIEKNKGKLEAVYNCKLRPSEGRWVQDIERGAMDSISPYPWQTDTSIGDWFYRTGQKYMTGTEVVQMLVDIVSKNGNLLLNVVQTPEGDLEPDVLNILDEIAQWTPANGEGIYGTRPWKVYGEGPSMKNQEKGHWGGVKDVRSYEPTDIRFTTKGETIYAFCMDKPSADIKITSLGKNSKLCGKTVSSVKMLGGKEKLNWKQESDALVIAKPAKLPEWQVTGFKIEFKK